MVCLIAISLLLIAVGVVFKIYWKLSTKRNGSYTCLVGKTAIVTGANTGIGYITALDFASRGARVILACRNKERAENAQRKIIKTTGNQNVIYKLIDLASLQSVRNFAEDFNKTEDRLNILVNNAGLVYMEEDYTADGIQSLFHINHLSPFLLTHLLIDKLKKSAPSRIVNVASLATILSTTNVSNFHKINNVPPVIISRTIRDAFVYCNSKLYNILFTMELAKRIDGSGVTANALHPGVIRSDFFRKLNGILKLIFSCTSALLLTPEEGAQTQIYLSVSEDVEGINGGLFTNCEQITFYRKARNEKLAKMLWTKSEEMAKLNEYEKLK